MLVGCYIWRRQKLCIFGAGLHAFVARVFAGMLAKVRHTGRDVVCPLAQPQLQVGLLPRGAEDHDIDDAYRVYRQSGRVDWENSKARVSPARGMAAPSLADLLVERGTHHSRHRIRRRLASSVASHFLCLIYVAHRETHNIAGSYPFTKCNPAINIFCHALALDEHRKRLTPLLFSKNPSEIFTDEAAETRSVVSSIRSSFKSLMTIERPGNSSDATPEEVKAVVNDEQGGQIFSQAVRSSFSAN